MVIQPAEHQLRQPRQRRHLASRLADREQQHHPLGVQPARHKPQHHRRLRIQPLHVIDHAHQRHRRRHVGQQRQHGQRDQEPVRRRPGHQAERAAQRLPLRNRQLFQLIRRTAAGTGAARRSPAGSPAPPRSAGPSACRLLPRRRAFHQAAQSSRSRPRRAVPGCCCSRRRPWPAGRRGPRVLPVARQAPRLYPSPPGVWGNVPHETSDAATLPRGHRSRHLRDHPPSAQDQPMRVRW